MSTARYLSILQSEKLCYLEGTQLGFYPSKNE